MKEKQKSVKLNMVMNMLLTMSNFIFPLITFPYVARILLPTGTGKVDFATSVVTYFSMFVQLGIPVYGIRACAKVRDNKEELSRVVHELLIINLFMAVIVYAVYGAAIIYIPKFNREIKLFLVMGTTILLNSLGVEWLYKGLEKYTYITIRSIIFKVIAFIAMFAFIHNESDYIKYGAITILAASASNILNFINLRKIIILKPIGNYKIRPHIKMIFVFFAMSVAATIYTNLDKVMLGFMKTDADVGYYGAAVKIKNILLSIVTAASTVLLPRASYYVDKGKMEDFYKILKKTMHFILMIASSFAVYFMIFAREGILFLSGDKFENSIVPMQIIMPTLIFIGITNVIGIQMMVPLGREKQVLYSEIAGAVVDLILNAILIPGFGASGAAIGTLIAEIVVLIWQICAIKDIKINIFEDISFGVMIFALICSGAVAFGAKLLNISLFLTLFISGIGFFGVYGLILIMFKDRIIIEVLGMIRGKLEKLRK